MQRCVMGCCDGAAHHDDERVVEIGGYQCAGGEAESRKRSRMRCACRRRELASGRAASGLADGGSRWRRRIRRVGEGRAGPERMRGLGVVQSAWDGRRGACGGIGLGLSWRRDG